MLIGIDFDNTIAAYDAAFVTTAREWGLLPPDFQGGKTEVRDTLRRLPDGETEWMRLQGRVYGALIGRAEMMPGLADFLTRVHAAGLPMAVVSHKTRHGHFDPDRVDLHQAARGWMAANGLHRWIDPAAIHFEPTREAKVARIAALGCTHFVDDLVEVFHEPGFPKNCRAILYAAGYQVVPAVDALVCRDFAAVARAVLDGGEVRQ